MKKKQALFIFLAVLLLFLAAPTLSLFGGSPPLQARAATYLGECGEDLTWELNTSTHVLTISGTGDMNDYDSLSQVPWYGIDSNLSTVILPDGLTSIGDYVFYSCSKLQNITIPEGVTSIGDYAFYSCSKLQNITIPEGVTSIGNYAFYNCSGLKTVSIPDSVTNINYNSFDKYNSRNLCIQCSLSSYALTYALNYSFNYEIVGDPATGACGDDLTWTLSVDGTLTISGSGDMYDYPTYYYYSYTNAAPWYNLRNVIQAAVVEEGVTSLGNAAFYDCSRLKSVTLPDGLVGVGASAFDGCDSLTSIDIPDSVTEIGDSAFYYCSSLTSVDIPDSVTEIGDSAFYRCSALTSVDIPDSVTEISASAFYYCSSLASVDIPDSVTSIGNSAFSGCSALSNVRLSNGLTEVGNEAFEYCTSLTSLTIPDNEVYISYDVFSGCSALTSVTIPDSASVDFNAFRGCGADVCIVCESNTSSAFQCALSNGLRYELQNGWQDITGTAGDLAWTLDQDGLMTVSGEGAIPYYNDSGYYSNSAPWKAELPMLCKPSENVRLSRLLQPWNAYSAISVTPEGSTALSREVHS